MKKKIAAGVVAAGAAAGAFYFLRNRFRKKESGWKFWKKSCQCDA